jgi:Flp pilus assembly protein TadB
MKSFVRDKEDDHWLFILIGVLTIAIFLLANAVGEIVYLPLLLLYSIQLARDYFRQRAKRRSKALLDAARSRGSR